MKINLNVIATCQLINLNVIVRYLASIFRYLEKSRSKHEIYKVSIKYAFFFTQQIKIRFNFTAFILARQRKDYFSEC